MNKWRNFLYIFLSFMPLLITTYFLFWENPFVWPDEYVTINTINNMKKNGGIPSVSIYNSIIPGLQEHAFWYPPLYYYFLYLGSFIISNTIYSLRILSVIFGILSLILLYFINKEILKNSKYAFLVSFLISGDIYFGQAARCARQEIFTFLLFLIALLFWIKFKPKKIFYQIIGSILIGLTVISHPIGFFMLPILLIYIFFEFPKKYFFKTLIVYLIFSITPFAVWIIYVFNDLNILLLQWQLILDKKKLIFPHLITIFNYGIQEKIFVLSLFIEAILLIVFYYQKKLKIRPWIIVIFIWSLFYVNYGKEQWYIVYLQPFLSLCILEIIINKRIKFLWKIPSYILIIFIFFIFNIHEINNSLLRIPYLENINNILKILKDNNIPKDTNILITSIPDSSPYLYENGYFNLYSFPPIPLDQQKYLDLFNKSKLIIFNNKTSDFINSKFLFSYIKKSNKKIILSGDKTNNFTFIIKINK